MGPCRSPSTDDPARVRSRFTPTMAEPAAGLRNERLRDGRVGALQGLALRSYGRICCRSRRAPRAACWPMPFLGNNAAANGQWHVASHAFGGTPESGIQRPVVTEARKRRGRGTAIVSPASARSLASRDQRVMPWSMIAAPELPPSRSCSRAFRGSPRPHQGRSG